MDSREIDELINADLDDAKEDIITYREQEWQELGDAFAELKQAIMDAHPFAKAMFWICDGIAALERKISNAWGR